MVLGLNSPTKPAQKARQPTNRSPSLQDSSLSCINLSLGLSALIHSASFPNSEIESQPQISKS